MFDYLDNNRKAIKLKNKKQQLKNPINSSHTSSIVFEIFVIWSQAVNPVVTKNNIQNLIHRVDYMFSFYL